LRHQAERPIGRAFERAPVAEAKLERVHHVFDNGIDCARQPPSRAQREPAATRLVARKPRAIDEQNPRARGRETVCGRRPTRPCADDERVEACDLPRLQRARSAGSPGRHATARAPARVANARV
jgi:hypothetical protein